jgi:hypothetical protein
MVYHTPGWVTIVMQAIYLLSHMHIEVHTRHTTKEKHGIHSLASITLYYQIKLHLTIYGNTLYNIIGKWRVFQPPPHTNHYVSRVLYGTYLSLSLSLHLSVYKQIEFLTF